MATLKVKGLELIALILMLIPILSIVGFIIYVVLCGAAKGNIKKIVIAILSIFIGFFASILLWLDAFNIINLDK